MICQYLPPKTEYLRHEVPNLREFVFSKRLRAGKWAPDPDTKRYMRNGVELWCYFRDGGWCCTNYRFFAPEYANDPEYQYKVRLI